MITISRNRTISVSFLGVDATAVFNVPTAEEVETVFRGNKDLKDTEVFKAFTTSISSSEIEGWKDGVKADTVVALPGTYPLVGKVVAEIMKAAVLSDSEKTDNGRVCSSC